MEILLQIKARFLRPFSFLSSPRPRTSKVIVAGYGRNQIDGSLDNDTPTFAPTVTLEVSHFLELQPRSSRSAETPYPFIFVVAQRISTARMELSPEVPVLPEFLNTALLRDCETKGTARAPAATTASHLNDSRIYSSWPIVPWSKTIDARLHNHSEVIGIRPHARDQRYIADEYSSSVSNILTKTTTTTIINYLELEQRPTINNKACATKAKQK